MLPNQQKKCKFTWDKKNSQAIEDFPLQGKISIPKHGKESIYPPAFCKTNFHRPIFPTIFMTEIRIQS